MAPYEPPCAHYAHVPVDLYSDDMVWSFVGMGGWRLYKLTEQLGLSYLWYNKDRRVIEIWGSYNSLKKNPGSKILNKLDNYVEKMYFSCQGCTKSDRISIQSKI